VKIWGSVEQCFDADRKSVIYRVRVQAPSQKRAVEILNATKLLRGYYTLYSFRQYWGERPAGAAAWAAEGEGVWWAPDHFGKEDWTRVWPKAEG